MTATPDIRTITTNPDVHFWAADLQRDPKAFSAVYYLDGAPIHAETTRYGWRFDRQ